MVSEPTYLYQTFSASLSWFERENKFILVRNELGYLNLMSKEEMQLFKDDLFYEETEFDTLRELLDYTYVRWPYAKDWKLSNALW